MATVKTSIQIHSSKEKVWSALTDPTLIEQYFFGTKVTADWRPGSKIIWVGEWEGKEYKEWGTVVEVLPREKLVFDYFSPAAGLTDEVANYNRVTQQISTDNDIVTLTITQENVKDIATAEHSKANWDQVLSALKTVVEKL